MPQLISVLDLFQLCKVAKKSSAVSSEPPSAAFIVRNVSLHFRLLGVLI